MKMDLVTRRSEQKEWVRKNLHKGQPVIFLQDGKHKWYAIMSEARVSYWIGSFVMTNTIDPKKDKIIKLKDA